MLVTSGKASTERFFAANRPAPHRANATTTTTSRCWSMARTTEASIRLFQLGELALVVQMKGAVHHNVLLRSNTFQHGPHVSHFGTQFDRNTEKAIIALSDKNIILIGLA